MRRLFTAAALAVLAIGLLAASAGGRPASLPKTFFGVAPQTELTDTDTAYMKAGGIGSIRIPFNWSVIQPTAKPVYDWSSVDAVVGVAARRGLTVFPFLYATPRWLAPQPTALPIDSSRARKAWLAFVKAAVERYRPGGEFWTEHAPPVAGINYVQPIPRPDPIRTWQVWNEANFFYFAYPVSPGRYARLLKLTHGTIKAADPGAEVILSGLFGSPDNRGKKGMPAAQFLGALYRVPGIKADFDAVALHPYAFHVDDFEELTEGVREVVVDNHDSQTGLYITELGWGSQNDPSVVAFEQGIGGQARELSAAYGFLIDNRNRLNIKGSYWFSWKDAPPGVCNFCDSVGLFRAGKGFRSKPAWHALVHLTGGRARP
jgi:hypothetical protein